ncbi:DUF998 domain-containing protein [Actinoplanes regularis]|uniref:DUF998 domain-containing protein n=1 Tax=Actinoplanes regularis TaxID=52697 RepID=A0A239JKZ4_9ACTN|nr:DUF998 domain-containing protein [Actinoplanes regularis]GIE92073.1 hypothetical protein Are01nite_85530 [Actinoplanes regularis]SNT06706.1 Protein of unknown function [Actinoplanes regularis]
MISISPAPRESRSIEPATVPGSIVGGLILPPAGFAVADWINPGWSPAETMISYYVHAPRGGWLIPLGVLVLAAASGTLTWLAAAYTRGGRAGLALLGVWTAALVVGGVFPADPPGRWDQPPSTAGALHGVAALLAFAVLPAAAVVLSRVWRRDPRWRPIAGGLSVLAALTVVAFVLFMITFFDVQGGPSLGAGPWATVTGLAERLMVWTYVGWLALAACGLRRIDREG